MEEDFYSGGTKRGSDELLSQSRPTNNDSDGSSQPPYDDPYINSDAKKVKLDQNQTNKRSRVIHIGNLPNEVTETEIIHLGNPFGRVTNILVLKGKNQAFLEMTDEVAAATMVNYFASSPAQLRGRNVYIQYSKHKELKTDSTRPSDFNKGDGLFQYAMPRVAIQEAYDGMDRIEIQGGPNTILRVIVEHMLHSVTLNVLHEIFSRYGKVLKIITFTKNNTYQALIQYADAATAQTAKEELNGQNIYNACCTLRIDYSKLTNLSVRYNNDKSRDYTNPGLPSGDNFGGAPGILSSPFGDMQGFGKSRTGYDSSIMGDKPLGMLYPISAPNTGSVLLVSNLNDEIVTPDILFTLFGVYGDVCRVKILYNKKDNALIQMAEPHQAQLSKTHLDRVTVYGRQIRIAHSKHNNIQMPREGQDDPTMTKDYTTSSQHRFKKPGSKNSQNIFPPSATLHLSNIPPSVSEDDIKDAFSNTGGNVEAFRFFPKDHKMALIEMGSIEEGIIALIKMHTYPLAGGNPLKVSFSKSVI